MGGFSYYDTYSNKSLASSFFVVSCRSSTRTFTVFVPKPISIMSPTFTFTEAFAGLPLTITRPASQASFATVRLLISRDTFKNLSSLIFFSLCLRSVPASKGSFSLKAKKWILQPQNPLCYLYIT